MSPSEQQTLEQETAPPETRRARDVPLIEVDAAAPPPRPKPTPKKRSPTRMDLSEEPFDLPRTPRALLTAIVMLLGVEVGLRVQNPADVIPYQNTGRQSYSAVRNYLHAEGSAPVAFMGSSRGREAIMVPVVRDTLRDVLGRRIGVANYSSPAAAADENAQILRIMLRQQRTPQIILYGVSPLQLSQSALKTDHAGELWYLQDWWREAQRNRDRQDELAAQLQAADDRDERRRILRDMRDVWKFNVLPDVLRNEIGLRYKTFGYREQAANILCAWFSDEKIPPCPLNGELSESQNKKRQRNLAEQPVKPRRVRNYLQKRMEAGAYPLGGRQLEHFRSICEQCREAGATLIVYELPLAQILKDHFPEGTMETFIAMVEDITDAHGVRFVRPGDLGLTLTDADFREQSHMNNTGAEKLSRALATQVIAPLLRER